MFAAADLVFAFGIFQMLIGSDALQSAHLWGAQGCQPAVVGSLPTTPTSAAITLCTKRSQRLTSRTMVTLTIRSLVGRKFRNLLWRTREIFLRASRCSGIFPHTNAAERFRGVDAARAH